jgi:hypothetical protein
VGNGGQGAGEKKGLVVLRISAGGLGRQGLIWHFKLSTGNLFTSTKGKNDNKRQYKW